MSDNRIPPPIFPDLSQIPEELRNLPRWCAFNFVVDPNGNGGKGKLKKPPCSAVTGEPNGWTESGVTAAEALAGAKKLGKSGIGFIFNGSDFFGVDWDDCADADGNIHAAVQDWRKWFPTYQEFSPSRTGLHFICRGSLATALTGTPLPDAPGAKVEAYSKGRFFCWTGWRIDGAENKVQDCTIGVQKLLSHLQVQEPSTLGSAAKNEKPRTPISVREFYERKLDELRNNPVNSGTGNPTLNNTALIAARVCASRVFDKSAEQFKQELLDVVTKQWQLPHPEQDARSTIESGWAKGASEGPYPLIEITTVEELQRPDMPASVLCGTLGDVCRTRLADFPIAYSWLSVLAAASVLVKPHHENRCNIYVATVGLPDSGKSEAQRRANYLFALDKQAGLVVDDKFGSAEGMMEKIGDRKGETFIWAPDELSHLLEKAQIQGASFPFILNTLFYRDRNDLTVQRRKQIPFNARVTIAGGVVEENFGDSFGAATTAGLYTRFLFGLCPSNFRYLYRPMDGLPVVEAKRVSALLPFGGEQDSTTQLPRFDAPVIHPDVWAARDKIHQQEQIEPRLLELCIRTAIICAAWDAKPELRASDLGPAWELARYQQRVRAVLQPNPGRNFDGIVAHKIMSYLKVHAAGEKWLKWRDVYRATSVMDFGSSVAERSMNALVFAGEIERTTIRPPKGGKGTVLIRLATE